MKEVKIYRDFWANVNHIITIKNEHMSLERKMGKAVQKKFEASNLKQVTQFSG